jgi:hypothetical protein
MPRTARLECDGVMDGMSGSAERRRHVGSGVPLLAVVLVSLLIVLGVAACGGGSSADAQAGANGYGGSRTNDEGKVTVKVTWDGRFDPLEFDVVLDTHSVELDGYDLAEMASVRFGGGALLKPSLWDAPKGGHHRQGTLAFGPVAPAGPYLELVIDGVDGRERVFRWDLTPPAGSP